MEVKKDMKQKTKQSVISPMCKNYTISAHECKECKIKPQENQGPFYIKKTMLLFIKVIFAREDEVVKYYIVRIYVKALSWHFLYVFWILQFDLKK